MWLYVDEKHIETIPPRSVIKEEPERPEVVITFEGEYEIGDKKLVIKPFVSDELFVFPESTANFAYVDLTKVHFPLTMRTRKEGDLINPFGMSGTMKLKKYMNSKGVNRHKRDEVLLLTNDEEVLWVVGVGLSNKISVVKTPTHVIEVI